jgi:hypothetical protein
MNSSQEFSESSHPTHGGDVEMQSLGNVKMQGIDVDSVLHLTSDEAPNVSNLSSDHYLS